MDIVQAARRGGKTTWLMKMLKSSHTMTVFVMSSKERHRLITEYHLNLNQADRIVPWTQKNRVEGLSKDRIYYIDNLDIFLHEHMMVPISGVTITKGEHG